MHMILLKEYFAILAKYSVLNTLYLKFL